MTSLLLGLLIGSQRDVPTFTVLENVTYRTVGKRKLMLDVYRPSGTRPPPFAIVVHGGGWIAGKRQDVAPLCEALARNGIAAVAVDYRLAPTAKWPAMLEDCQVAASYVNAQAGRLGLRRDSAVTAGFSAGAHIALLMAMKDTEPGAQKAGAPKKIRFKGVLNVFGPTQLNEDFPLDLRDAVSKSLIGKPYSLATKSAEEMSPVAHVSRDAPPVFTIHGEQDTLVPVMQATRLDKALKAAGVDSTVRVIPGMGHELKTSLPACSLAVEDGIAFLMKRLAVRRTKAS